MRLVRVVAQGCGTDPLARANLPAHVDQAPISIRDTRRLFLLAFVLVDALVPHKPLASKTQIDILPPVEFAVISRDSRAV
jgi:hypothetical protein